MAVAFGELITLWNPENGEYHGTLCFPATLASKDNAIRRLEFMNDGSHYLVASTKTRLHVWSTLTFTGKFCAYVDLLVLSTLEYGYFH